MASSKVMVSTEPTNPDLPRYSPSSSSLIHHLPNHNSSSDFPSQYKNSVLGLFPSNDHINGGLGSVNMDDLLGNMYAEHLEAFSGTEANGDGGAAADGGDEVAWGELGNGGQRSNDESRMTLEAYLTKAAAMTEEDARVSGVVNVLPTADTGNYGMESMMNSVQYQHGTAMQNCPTVGFAVDAAAAAATSMGFGNGMVVVGGTSGAVAASGGARGKRRAVEAAPLDKATQQKQRRMIKNRESAARSRERKQAYTVELEALVTRLEEENARLLKEEAELKKQRFKQLIEEVKPVVEKRRPPKAVMRRSSSMSW